MILYHPDPEPTEGDPKPEPKPEGGGDEKVKALEAELAKAREAGAKLTQLQSDVGLLFSPAASEAQRQEALMKVMQVGGISEQDVRTMMSEIMEEQPDPDPTKPEPKPAAKPKEEDGGPILNELAALRNEMEAFKAASQQDRQKQSKAALANAIEPALTKDADTIDLLGRIKDKRGEDHANKVASALRKDVLRETLESLYARKAQVGTFNPDWISEEAQKAVTATLEKAKALMISDDVGKAPGLLEETALLSEIASKDLKPPSYDKGRTSAENADDVESYTVRRLQKLAAQTAVKSAQGGASKA